MGDHALASLREAHARCALIEQVVTEKILQALDLRADRGLRHAERSRRLGETAQIDDGNQGSQQVGRDIHDDVSTLIVVVRTLAAERDLRPSWLMLWPLPFSAAQAR